MTVKNEVLYTCYLCTNRSFPNRDDLLFHLTFTHYSKDLLSSFPYTEAAECTKCTDKPIISTNRSTHLRHVGVYHREVLAFLPQSEVTKLESADSYRVSPSEVNSFTNMTITTAVKKEPEENELPKDASLLDNLPRRSLKRSCQVRNIAPGAYQENLDYEDDYPQDIHVADMTDSEEDPEYELPKKHISSSESDGSDAPTEPRKKKKNVLNNNTTMPPRNPHNLEFRDEHGNTIAPGTVEYTTRFAEHEQIIKGTLNKYKRDYKLFQDYVCHYFENGEDIVGSMKPNDIDKASLTFLISSYLTDRSNITHYRKTNEVRLLEPSTLERIWYGLSHMIKKEIGYDITKDEAFGTAKQAKLSAMRLSKKVPGLGENASASIPWTLSMVIYVLSNDMLNFYTPEGLIGLFYFLLMIYFLPRVKTEIMGLTRGDFVRVKNWKGETIGVVYVPKGTTKKDRGNKTVRDAAGYYKR